MTEKTAIKVFLRVLLILLVTLSFAPRSEAVAASTAPAVQDRVVAYYFHGDVRCSTCRKIEEFTRAAIVDGFPAELKDGRLSFEVVNVEKPENRHFLQDYSLVSKSVVLSLKKGDRELRFKNLDRIWQLAGSRTEFIDYVQGETKKLLAEVKQ